MADSIAKLAIAELETRLAAYSFPEIETGTGSWTVNTVATNPKDIDKYRAPVIFLFWNPQPAGIVLENVGQWMVTYMMQASLRVKRFANPEDVALLLANYLQQAIWHNTSGTIDPGLAGYAGNLIFRDVEADFGDAMEPIIDVHVGFDVQILYAISDPTSIV